MKPLRYTGSLVFITGGSSGIGLATAVALAREGAAVHLMARSPSRLATAVETIHRRLAESGIDAASWPSVTASAIDVSSAEGVASALEADFRKIGVPDILVNCAGMARPGYFQELTPEIMQTTIQTNLLGTMYVCLSVYRAMLASGKHGHIINVSSLAGLIGVFGYTAYGASKFGIIGFSATLRAEARLHGIKVSVLCPPDTDTPQLHEENKYKPAETRAVSGNARLLTPESVADALLSRLPSNRFIIFADRTSAMIHAINRFMPWLVEFFMHQDVMKVQKQASSTKGTQP
jgi:NAD(P)-dependent dehydrogenase (short-subunit alcohol dehydrogenase family)